MADALFDVSIVEGLRRDKMHARDLDLALESLARRLKEEGIPFALLGALAMRRYGFVRHTEDIDILTTPEGLDRIHEKLVGRGIIPRAKGLRKGLKDTVHKVMIDVIKSGENAGANSSPLLFPDPRSDVFTEIEGIRVPTLAMLIQFKICSGLWGHRLTDLADVTRLIRINRLDEAFGEKLIPELREKYRELWGESQKEVELGG